MNLLKVLERSRLPEKNCCQKVTDTSVIHLFLAGEKKRFKSQLHVHVQCLSNLTQ